MPGIKSTLRGGDGDALYGGPSMRAVQSTEKWLNQQNGSAVPSWHRLAAPESSSCSCGRPGCGCS